MQRVIRVVSFKVSCVIPSEKIAEYIFSKEVSYKNMSRNNELMQKLKVHHLR